MKLKMILPYILLFFISVIVFLFVLFPEKQLARYLNVVLTSPQGNVQTHIERVKPALPYFLKFDNTTILIGKKKEIVPDMLKVHLTPGLVFGEHRKMKFNALIYGGKVKGMIGFENMESVAYTNSEIVFDELNVEQFKYKTRLADMILNCSISGKYTDPLKNQKKAPGSGSMIIRDFTADLKNSLFNRLNLPKIDFSTVKIEFLHRRNTLNINQLTAKGSVINVKLKGKITLMLPVDQSRLALSGSVLPDSPYLASFVNSAAIRAVVKNAKKDGIQFSITGTFSQPKIKL